MSTPNHRPAPKAPSQAAALGWNSPGEEDATGKSRKISGGGYPAGFVLAEAPAHASKGELAANRDGWCREVLRINPPLGLVPHSGRLGKKQIAASVEMTAEKWLEGATKIDVQFSGAHVKWAPETTKAEVEK